MRLLGWLGLLAVLSLALAEQRSEVQAEDGLLRRNKLSREDIQRLRGKLHSLISEVSDLKTDFHTPAEQSEVMRMAAKTPAVPIDSALPEVTSQKEAVPSAALETSDAASASVQDDVTMPDEFFKESKAALARLKANVVAEARAQRMEEQLGDRFSRAAAAIVARQDAESPQEDLSFAEASNEAAAVAKNAAKGKSGSAAVAKAKARELAMAGGTPSLSSLSIDDIDMDASNDLQDEKLAAGDASAEVAAHAALLQGRAGLDAAKQAAKQEQQVPSAAKKKINQIKEKLLKQQQQPTEVKKVSEVKNNKLKVTPTVAAAGVVTAKAAAAVTTQSPAQLLDTSDKVRESSTGAEDTDTKEPDPRAKDILTSDIKPETKKEEEFGDAEDDKNAVDEKPKTQEQADADEKPIITAKSNSSPVNSLAQDECIKKCKHGTCKDGICNCEGAWTGSDCNTPPPAGADKAVQSSTAASPQQSTTKDSDTKASAQATPQAAAAADTQTAKSSAAGAVFDTPVTTIPRGALKVTTVLALDFDTIATSGKDKDTFVNQFAADVAKALGISQQRIQVMGVRAGSVIVSFAITASDTDTRTVADLATQFQEMAQDPGSPLHKGIVSAHIDPSMAVKVEAGEGAVWSSASRLASPTLLSLLACVLATLLALALSS